MTTAYERVTERLIDFTGYHPAREGGEWKCPAHKGGTESNPSLSVTPNGNKVLIHCQAGCPLPEVLSALRLEQSDLFDTPKANDKEEWTPRGPAIAVYPYVDENGFTLFEVCRTADKQFPLRVPDSTTKSGYRWRIGDARRVIYRLPKVIEAVAQGWPVWIVEGEKDVHALEGAGEVATCNPGGAEKWRVEYAPTFKGARVFIVADKDGPGRRHADRVKASLESYADSVVVVEALEGKDAYDHIVVHGRRPEEFLRIRDEEVLVGDIVPETPESVTPVNDSGPGSGVTNPFIPVPLDLTTKPEPRPRVADQIYRAGLTVMQSEPGVGKTWFAIWIAIQLMQRGGSVLYFDEEGGEELARERLFALGATNELIHERLHYFPFESRKWDDDDIAALDAVIDTVGDNAIAVFDSLPDFLAAAGKSEDSAQDVTEFVNKVLGRLRAAGIAQLVLDHMRKPEQGKGKAERSRYSRGSSAKLAKADVTLLLEVAKPFDASTSGQLRLWKTKDRYGRLPVPRLDEPGALIDVIVNDGSVQMQPVQPSDIPAWNGPTECMAKIVEVLSVPGEPELKLSEIREVVPFRNEVIRQALSQLVYDEVIIVRAGPHNSLHYKLTNPPGTLNFGGTE